MGVAAILAVLLPPGVRRAAVIETPAAPAQVYGWCVFVDAFLCYLLAPGSPAPPLRAPVLEAICLEFASIGRDPARSLRGLVVVPRDGSAPRPTAGSCFYVRNWREYGYSDLRERLEFGV